MSALRGIATGFLQAKIRNTEANDALKANTLMRVGETLIGETIPNAVAAEKVRRTNYDMLSSEFTPNFAEVADKSGFTLNDDTMDVLRKKLKEGNLDKKALENANFQTDFNTRYNTRVATAEEKYQPILKQLGIDGIGSLGYNTVESLVKPQAMDTVTTKDQMTDTVTTQEVPKAFSSMQLGDYLTKSPISYDIPESEFQKVASTMRQFGQFFTQDPRTGEPVINLNDTNRDEYNALRNISQEISQNYLDQDGKVNVSAAMTAASNMLTGQTSSVIYGRQLGPGSGYENDYEQGIASADGKTFSQNFNNTYKTDIDKKQYLSNGLRNLDGGQVAQRFFAQSFPKDVQFNDGTAVRDYLLRLTGLLR
ncbi:hypothetical protein HTVC033P_gp53 [Pelagibacter phage HTVC033P]|nr:hypothetical protein HTVC033P_gp53 [Pelagibacter phage HTVC033P]